MAKYLVVSTVVTDEVWTADRQYTGAYLGGAGLYAYCGLRLWTDDAAIISGVGEDFFSLHGSWLRENRVCTDGLSIRDPHTPCTVIQYRPDGERTETPRYGKEHYRRMEASPSDMIPFFEDARGVYIFQKIPENYWEIILAEKENNRFSLAWELHANIAAPAHLAQVRKIAEACDILSLNQTEALSLLGFGNLTEAAERLSTWQVPLIYLRAGARGGMILEKGRIIKVPPVSGVHAADPTGAGNSSTAAVLYGFCEGYTPRQCGVMGSISAAKCIAQMGPPPLSGIDRNQLYLLLAQMSES